MASTEKKIARLESDLARALEEGKTEKADKIERKIERLAASREGGKPDTEAAPRPKRRILAALPRRPKNSTASLVGYEQLSEDGIMRIDSGHYGIALSVDDVNYIGAREDEKADVRLMWADYVNSLDHTVEVSPHLLNRKISAEQFEASLAMPPVMGDEAGNVLRDELNAYCADRLARTSRSMKRDRVLVIKVDAPTRDKAAPILAREAERFIRLQRDLGSDARVLSGQEWMDAICAYTHPRDAAGTVGFGDLVGTVGLTTADLVAPNQCVHCSATPADARMIVGGEWVKTYVMDLDGYGSTMRDTFIADLSSLPYTIGVTWHIRPWETGAAISAASNQLTNVTTENNAYKITKSRPERGYFIDDETLPAPMRDAQEEAQALRDDLVRNDMRNFSVTTVVLVMGADEVELEEACREVENVFSAHRKAIPDAWGCLREQAYTAALPVGVCELPYGRTLTTAPVANMLMWSSAELMDDGGMIMGVNQATRNFITYDPARYEHSNSFTLAMPRGGKSVNAKLTRIIQNRLRHPDDDIVIIDPEAEYMAVTRALGGQTINLSETSADHVNPLDISDLYGADDRASTANPVPAKVSFIQALVRMMAHGVTDAQINMIDRAASLAYADWLDDPRPENLPTLQTVYDTVKAMEGSGASDPHALSKLLYRFVEGTLGVFNHPTDVELTDHLVDFVLADLSKELKPIAMLVLLDHIWVRVSSNRKSGRRTWLIVDEFQLLLDDEATVDTLDRFFTRGRKWDLYINAVTQNLSRVMDSERTRYMLQNSPFLTIMNQSPDSARELGDLLSLSDSQIRLLRTCSPGQGLYVTQSAVIPFDFTIDPRVCPKLYSLVTTSPEDIKRMMARERKSARASAPAAPAIEEPDPTSPAEAAAVPAPIEDVERPVEPEPAHGEPEEPPAAPEPAPEVPEEVEPEPTRDAEQGGGAAVGEDPAEPGDARAAEAPRYTPAEPEKEAAAPDRATRADGDVLAEIAALLGKCAVSADALCEVIGKRCGERIEEPPAPVAEATADADAAPAAGDGGRAPEPDAGTAPLSYTEPDYLAHLAHIREARTVGTRRGEKAPAEQAGASYIDVAEDLRAHYERMQDQSFYLAYGGLVRSYEDGDADPSEFGIPASPESADDGDFVD